MTNRDILDELRVGGELIERLKRIAPRFREIIILRYGLSFETGLIVRGEMTLEQVAKLYSITNERVRQIEKKVFKELSEGLTDSPWHTGIPTEEGWYLLKVKSDDEVIYDTNRLIQCLWGLDWKYVHEEILAWQKIEPDKEESNG